MSFTEYMTVKEDALDGENTSVLRLICPFDVYFACGLSPRPG